MTLNRVVALLLYLLATSALTHTAQAQTVRFAVDSPLESQSGTAAISWQLPKPPQAVELQIASSPEFSDARMLYTGTDTATFLSGLANGTYYLRLRQSSGRASS